MDMNQLQVLGWSSKKSGLVKRITLPETNISHENRQGPNRKFIFQPSIFRGENVSFREGNHHHPLIRPFEHTQEPGTPCQPALGHRAGRRALRVQQKRRAPKMAPVALARETATGLSGRCGRMGERYRRCRSWSCKLLIVNSWGTKIAYKKQGGDLKMQWLKNKFKQYWGSG